ncbi:cytochrome c-type biogenesis protein CcmF [Desulfovibrionales bacterium]
MHLFAHATLVIALVIALAGAFTALAQLWTGRQELLTWIERCQLIVLGLSTVASFVLYRALIARDFDFLYVTEYTDLTLPLLYTITAFWAGQSGSLLFWLWTVALLGMVFWTTDSYRKLSQATCLCFWVFYHGITAFLLLLLTSYSSPFQQVTPPPADGNGLNPLLQNPGMIFHPPLLFLGYAGFTVPACLALAQLLMGRGNREKSLPTDRYISFTVQEPHWAIASRNFTLLAWLLLTAGIILGGWWAYMELGWGGYWAWDPVENASLIPWLVGTAALHTTVLETRRGSLPRTNTLLMALTLITSFFATYLVRSGVVDSLHAFGESGLSGVLLVFILISLALVLLIIHAYPPPAGRPLAGIGSRDGFLTLTIWILLALGLIIMLATLWPVLSKTWSSNPHGLSADFYNRVCLPFFVLLAGVLTICPWLTWKGGFTNRRRALYIVGAFLGTFGVLWFVGMHKLLATFATASAMACLVSYTVLLITHPGMCRMRCTWAAYGVHVGLALVIIGVAFSGPYQTSIRGTLKFGQHLEIAGYKVTYANLRNDKIPNITFIEATLCVTRDGHKLGMLTPQRRIYRNFNKPFSEVSVIPSLGDELYATLESIDEHGDIIVKINVNPLINWIWIGGTLIILFPFLGMSLKGKSIQPTSKDG